MMSTTEFGRTVGPSRNTNVALFQSLLLELQSDCCCLYFYLFFFGLQSPQFCGLAPAVAQRIEPNNATSIPFKQLRITSGVQMMS
jgi:hypothetical protein